MTSFPQVVQYVGYTGMAMWILGSLCRKWQEPRFQVGPCCLPCVSPGGWWGAWPFSSGKSGFLVQGPPSSRPIPIVPVAASALGMPCSQASLRPGVKQRIMPATPPGGSAPRAVQRALQTRPL